MFLVLYIAQMLTYRPHRHLWGNFPLSFNAVRFLFGWNVLVQWLRTNVTNWRSDVFVAFEKIARFKSY